MTEKRNWWAVVSSDNAHFCAVRSDTKPPENEGMKVTDESGDEVLLEPGTFRVLDKPMTQAEALAWTERILRGTGQDVDLDTDEPVQ